MEMLDIVLFVPHYTTLDVLRYIDFQEEKDNDSYPSLGPGCCARPPLWWPWPRSLSYLKLMELPNGGSPTPAMFPIILFAVRWGPSPA